MVRLKNRKPLIIVLLNLKKKVCFVKKSLDRRLPYAETVAYVVRDVKAGEKFGEENVRSIRPGHGLHPRHFEDIMGKPATKDIERGTPLSWDLVA